jgi:energy-converting hydrogenase Eha subunit H
LTTKAAKKGRILRENAGKHASGAKALLILKVIGTTEVVPFHKTFGIEFFRSQSSPYACMANA